MTLGDNLWRLPIGSDPVRYTCDQVPPAWSKTSSFVPTAAALKTLAQSSLPDLEVMFVHDIWCHPDNEKLDQIYKARRGKGFPTGFLTHLHRFKYATCAVSKRTCRYSRSKRVTVAKAKRATQARARCRRKQRSGADLTESKKTEPASEQDAQKQDSGAASESVTCDSCQRIFGSAQALTIHLKELNR